MSLVIAPRMLIRLRCRPTWIITFISDTNAFTCTLSLMSVTSIHTIMKVKEFAAENDILITSTHLLQTTRGNFVYLETPYGKNMNQIYYILVQGRRMTSLIQTKHYLVLNVTHFKNCRNIAQTNRKKDAIEEEHGVTVAKYHI